MEGSLLTNLPPKIKKLEEIASFEYGYTANAIERGEFRYIRITDIDKFGEISELEKKYVDLSNSQDQEKYLLKKGDLVVARVGSVGKTAIFQNQEKSIFASYLIKINLNQGEILPKYYWYFTKTREYWNQVEQLTKGTIQPQFNANSLKDIKVPIPSLEKQKKIIFNWEEKRKIIIQQKSLLDYFWKEEREILNSFFN